MVHVMVTGHRPDKLGGYDLPNPTEQWVRATLRSLLEGFLRKHGDVTAISGMAIGADQIYCEVALDLGVPVIAAVPFEGQESMWSRASQDHYHALLGRCAQIEYICDPGYELWKMHHRNQWLVDQADFALAVWNGSSGGTGDTVRRIMKAGVPAVQLDPSTRRVQRLAV